MQSIEVMPSSLPIAGPTNPASLGPSPAWIQFVPPWDSVIATAATPHGEKSVAVVVADDDPVSREIISTTVSKWGFRTIVTQDGYEAMAAIRTEHSPSIAILDWMMPGIDGLEICRRVRQGGRMIYIILLTMRSGKENLIEGLRAGADDYLVKPFHADELHARILVGLRVMKLQETLADRVKALEAAASEIKSLKLQILI
jgi:phosphoserine phosphatase RsbU/P